MHINLHTKLRLPLSITSWGMKMSPKIRRWRRGCAHAPPSEKNFNLLKLLIISIYIPNFSFLTQLLPEIWSPLFAIGLILASEISFCFFPTRSLFFWCRLGLWVFFWLNLTKTGFLGHYSFSLHSITSLLTTLNFAARKLQL